MEWPLTRAERTDYAETSRHADVLAFLGELQKNGGPVWVESIGKSTEGREIPLVVASVPLVTNPADARRLGRPIVYVQANIHAGEVEGKEAILAILRRLCQDAGDPRAGGGLLGKIVLLVTPNYNPDGNEKFGPCTTHRPEQDGPAQVGVRANGQGFDLNRDAIKAESPEMRGVLEHVYTTWDPDVMMDLHTTNGTRHGYELTYAPPLNPNTAPEILTFSRDSLLPDIRKQMQSRYRMPLFDYGNVERHGTTTAWYSVAPDGRYHTNYVGLRNRVGILSEATSFIPFKDRVVVTDRFVMLILEAVAARSRDLLERTRAADARVIGWGMRPQTAPPLGVRFDFASRGEEEIPVEKSGASKDPTARPKEKDIERLRLPVYDRFVATRTARFPAAYFLPADADKLVELLRRHGVAVERLKEEWSGPIEQFTVTEAAADTRPFQGHRLIRMEGTFRTVTGRIPAGAYLVRTAQPLGILIFHMLEPEGTDGAAAWGVLGETFPLGQPHPVIKTMEPVRAAADRI